MRSLIAELLRSRVRTGGAEPLITYYVLGSGERTELSATTFANWVDKTANLLTELSVESGDPVALPLATVAPGHWITAIWELACWQAGAVVILDGPSPAELCVCGPDWGPYAGSADEVIACSLSPLPLGLGAPTPPGVTDFDLAVRAQPDRYAFRRPDPAGAAWVDRDRRLTQADLVAETGEPHRRLLRPTQPWTTARDGIVAALVTGGSVVTVVGDDEAALTRIAETERVDP